MQYVQPDVGNLQGVYRQGVEARARFITRTYGHLAAAVLAFAAIEIALFQSGLAVVIAEPLMSNWFIVIGGLVVGGWLASRWAHNASSMGMQYVGLSLYVVMQAVIFAPLLLIAQTVAPGAIQSATVVTLLGFGGLTAIAFVTRKDFSFLGGIIKWGGVMAMVAIVAGMIFGFQLGTFFSVAMVALAGASVLWDTSNVLHHFPENRYVGAALELFASLALMFWYILRLFISSRD
jgi:FtsH-binding integral membrane protein